MRARTRIGVFGAVAAAAALWAGPAYAACPEVPTSQPFAPWGDNADYFAVPGGSFEEASIWNGTGTPGTLSEENPFALDPGDDTAAQLHVGDGITSPPVCVTRDHPHMRFTARSTDPNADLMVDAFYADEYGVLRRVTLATVEGEGFEAWGLSDPVSLMGALPRGGSRMIFLRFRARVSGEWLVDDVFVDPVKRG